MKAIPRHGVKVVSGFRKTPSLEDPALPGYLMAEDFVSFPLGELSPTGLFWCRWENQDTEEDPAGEDVDSQSKERTRLAVITDVLGMLFFLYAPDMGKPYQSVFVWGLTVKKNMRSIDARLLEELHRVLVRKEKSLRQDFPNRFFASDIIRIEPRGTNAASIKKALLHLKLAQTYVVSRGLWLRRTR